MAETGSTRVPRRINTLFASISTKGGRRVPHSTTTTATPPPFSHSQSTGTQYGCEGPGGKRDCAELVLTAVITPPLTPPFSASHHRQAGTLCCTAALLHYRLQHTR